MEKYSFLVYGLLLGSFLGSIGWAMLRFICLCIRDWLRKKKEVQFRLGSDIKNESSPKLISIDDD